MAKQETLKAEIIEGICQIIADTDMGLTGTEIGKILADSRIPDTDPSLTKWKRLYNAFINWQNRHQCSNNIWDFIRRAMAPVRYLNDKDKFAFRRIELNKRLSFIGIEISEAGKFLKTDKVETISEAEKKADRLKSLLKDRNVHQDVLRFCKAELLQDNYFHAVFETTKSVADKIRDLAGLTSDGNELIDSVFAINNPILIINNLTTETEKSEHKGFANLLRGFFGMFRNTTAHSPKIKWSINEIDALDIMTLASLFHRRLDNSHKIRNV
ncbi:MAG: TIGR02391 family protein [Ignavibacteriales bacterium]|nr:TIGR02391 family protein [Ignavibacteriales bacterium]MBN2683035.1 TIGR02391 family protein [Bacteroidales bacterium]